MTQQKKYKVIFADTSGRECVEEDGGVVKSFNSNAPKVINSTNPVRFYCYFSTVELCDCDAEFCGVFTLEAKLKNGVTAARFKSREQSNAFECSVDFMERVQDIVAKYSFAKRNGMYTHVQGLPDMCGSEISVEYDSGEYIHASDNQSCFIPLSAAKELILLFKNTK